jgi:hypothetical protein
MKQTIQHNEEYSLLECDTTQLVSEKFNVTIFKVEESAEQSRKRSDTLCSTKTLINF